MPEWTELGSNGVAYIGPAQTLDEALIRLHAHIGFMGTDTETVSTSDRRAIGIGFAISPVEAFYFTAFKDDPQSQHSISPYISHAISTQADDRVKVWFNASFDLNVLDEGDDPFLPNIGDLPSWQDVSIACRIQALPNSLEECAGEVFAEVHQTIREILPKGKSMLSLQMRDVAWKCMHDCMMTWRLWDTMDMGRWFEGEHGYVWHDLFGVAHDVTPEMIRAYHTDRQLIPILRRMGKKGLALNEGFLREHYTELAARKFHYRDLCLQNYGFQPGSGQAVGLALAKRGNFLPWTKKGQYKQYKTDEDTLLNTGDPVAFMVVEYKKAQTQLSNVLEPLLGKPPGEKGKKVPYADWVPMERFTTHFKLDLATSRLSSFDRNLQNITPSMREMFDPDSGSFTYWDANQIEYRIFGHLTQEPSILDAYRLGQNVHIITMQTVWPGQHRWLCCGYDGPKCTCKETKENPLYTDAKSGNYAILYGVMVDTLMRVLKRPREFCQRFIDGWKYLNPVAVKQMELMKEDGLEHGWVPTLEGRRCRLPDPAQQGPEHTANCAINYRIQGTSAWPIKLALIDGDKAGYDQRSQLHDEVLIDGGCDLPDDYKLECAGVDLPVEFKRGQRHWF